MSGAHRACSAHTAREQRAVCCRGRGFSRGGKLVRFAAGRWCSGRDGSPGASSPVMPAGVITPPGPPSRTAPVLSKFSHDFMGHTRHMHASDGHSRTAPLPKSTKKLSSRGHGMQRTAVATTRAGRRTAVRRPPCPRPPCPSVRGRVPVPEWGLAPGPGRRQAPAGSVLTCGTRQKWRAVGPAAWPQSGSCPARGGCRRGR